MSLRTRLNLLISALTLVSLTLSLWLVINNAKVAVEAELRSASNLTVQLLNTVLEAPEHGVRPGASHGELLNSLAGFDAHRHIRLGLHEGREAPSAVSHSATRRSGAPRWFIHFVEPPLESFYRVVPLHGGHREPGDTGVWATVNAEPADEISEAWKGSRGLLAILIGFALTANILIPWLVGRALKPLGQILQGLDRLEHGIYSARLPRFSAPEFQSVSQQFNKLSTALELSRQANRRLTRRNLEVQEAERLHLARELHDEMGQCLTAIRAEAVTIARRADTGDSATRESAEAIAETAGQVYGLTRCMIHRLRPPALQELGLAPALKQMITEWMRMNPGVACRFEIPEQLCADDPNLAMHLYRVLQECLTNISRHADASLVAISVDQFPDRVRLEISDNGRGFDPKSAHGGFGFAGIRERVAGLGGEVRIQSLPGHGTRVQVQVPMHQATPVAQDLDTEGRDGSIPISDDGSRQRDSPAGLAPISAS
jgi:two-component system, NarL family, sensor histidine kinase UhpB